MLLTPNADREENISSCKVISKQDVLVCENQAQKCKNIYGIGRADNKDADSVHVLSDLPYIHGLTNLSKRGLICCASQRKTVKNHAQFSACKHIVLNFGCNNQNQLFLGFTNSSYGGKGQWCVGSIPCYNTWSMSKTVTIIASLHQGVNGYPRVQ